MFRIGLLLLLAHATMDVGLSRLAATEFPLGDVARVRLADKSAAAAVLTARDAFVAELSPFDRQARLKTDREVSEREFLEFAGRQVVPWGAEDSEKIGGALNSLAPKLAEW